MSEHRREVAELRAQALKLDQQVLEALEARARLSRQVHALVESDPPIMDVDEREWLASIEAAAQGDLPLPSLRAIFREIRAAARSLEQPVRVAYLGPEGGFSQQVARGYFGAASPLTDCMTAADCFDDVARGRSVYAVVPFESSEDGLVQSTIGALAQSELVLVAEQTQPQILHLMNGTGNLADIEKIYATTASRAACARLLARDFARSPLIDVRSPVVAAELARDDHGSAALVPEACGSAARLIAVQTNVGDAPDLRVRYAIVSARPAMRSGDDTTCLVFSVDDTPGALFAVLRHFAERGINLRKLQSRPVRGESWDYVFYVEVSGHVTDRPVVTALEAVKKTTKYLRVLGSFPALA